MAASSGWEREFLNNGFSQVTVAFLRNVELVVQPGIISLDVNEIEALMHEFRLLRNELDVLRSDVVENSVPDMGFNNQTVTSGFYSLSTNVSITAKAFQFIAVTGKATIKLPEVPASNDVVTVLNVNGNQVTVDGNGNLINGELSTVSSSVNTTINYHYFKDLGAWYMR